MTKSNTAVAVAPADAAPAESTSRRGFITTVGGLGAAWVGATLYPVYRYLSPQPAPDPFGKEGRAVVEKITVADVAKPGMGKNGAYAGRGLIILRAANGELRGFDAKCSHAGCNVGFKGARIECPCHGGVYDLEGKNVSGPPPKPLVELQVIEQDGVLYVARKGGPGPQRA